MPTKISFNSYELKLVAMLLMIIDHLASLFGSTDSVVAFFMRFLGRGSAPIFAFVFCYSIRRTSSIYNLSERIFTFAIIAQIPFSLFNFLITGSLIDILSLNILFTFWFTLLIFANIENPISKSKLFFAILLLIFSGFFSDWGFFFPAWCLIFYYIHNTMLMVLSFFITNITLYLLLYDPHTQILVILTGILGAMISLPFICNYDLNKGGGRLGRYFFYWFYPIHFVILSLIYILGSHYDFQISI